MNSYDIKRLILMNAILAKIEAMKIYNKKFPDDVGYRSEEFFAAENELTNLAYKHDEQL